MISDEVVEAAAHERIDPRCVKWREPRGWLGRWLDLRGRGKWCKTCWAARKTEAPK